MVLLKNKSVHPDCIVTIEGKPYYRFVGNNDGEIVLCSSAKFVDVENDVCIVCTTQGIYFTRHVCKVKSDNELETMRSLVWNSFHQAVVKYALAVERGIAHELN